MSQSSTDDDRTDVGSRDTADDVGSRDTADDVGLEDAAAGGQTADEGDEDDTDLLETIELGPEWGTPGRAVPRLADCTGPVPVGCRLTSKFGKRKGGWHAGQDVAPPKPAQQGVPIHAVAAGTVQAAKTKALKGHSGIGVVVRHPGGVATYYGHLAEARVSTGQTVSAGQVVGIMGFTGNTVPSGPGGTHLHLGVIVNGGFVDPQAFLRSNGVVIGRTEPVPGGHSGPGPGPGPGPVRLDPAERVRSAGYPVGPGGVLEAVKAYQRTNKLFVDGDWGPVTERHYQFTRRLQSALNQWKAVRPKLRVDGDLGSRTREALRQMQGRNGLAVTGEADAATRARLGV